MSKQQAPPVFAHFDFELWHVAAGSGSGVAATTAAAAARVANRRTDRGIARHKADSRLKQADTQRRLR